MLTSSKFTEIACRFWNLVVEKLKNNTTGRFGVDGNVKLKALGGKITLSFGFLALTNTLDLDVEDGEVLESLNIV